MTNLYIFFSERCRTWVWAGMSLPPCSPGVPQGSMLPPFFPTHSCTSPHKPVKLQVDDTTITELTSRECGWQNINNLELTGDDYGLPQRSCPTIIQGICSKKNVTSFCFLAAIIYYDPKWVRAAEEEPAKVIHPRQVHCCMACCCQRKRHSETVACHLSNWEGHLQSALDSKSKHLQDLSRESVSFVRRFFSLHNPLQRAYVKPFCP